MVKNYSFDPLSCMRTQRNGRYYQTSNCIDARFILVKFNLSFVHCLHRTIDECPIS